MPNQTPFFEFRGLHSPKSWRKLNFICVFALLALLAISCSRTPDNPDQVRAARIESLRSSVVSFALRYKDGKKVPGGIYGSGFFVSDKHIATALHVGRLLETERNSIGPTVIHIVVQKSDSTTKKEFTIPVSLEASDEENDLAIYSFDPNDIRKQWSDFAVQALPLSDELPRIGDEVSLTGYFEKYPEPFTSIGTVSMISGESFALGETTFNGAVFADLTTIPGHSGGPLYSIKTQTVVGVSTRVLRPEHNLARIAIATNSIHLRRLLQKVMQPTNSDAEKTL